MRLKIVQLHTIEICTTVLGLKNYVTNYNIVINHHIYGHNFTETAAHMNIFDFLAFLHITQNIICIMTK